METAGEPQEYVTAGAFSDQMFEAVDKLKENKP